MRLIACHSPFTQPADRMLAPRRNILGDAKLVAKGTPNELQIVSGWTHCTRQLLIALPDDKSDAWS
jgi:hypothetical protein